MDCTQHMEKYRKVSGSSNQNLKGGVPRGASPPPPPGILAFPSIPSTQNAFPLHKTAYAFRDICYITNYICYITNSYNSWKICLKILPIYWFYHLPSCFTAYILILPPAKLTLLPANEQSPPPTMPPGAPLSMQHNLTRNINFTASHFNGTVKYLYMYFN